MATAVQYCSAIPWDCEIYTWTYYAMAPSWPLAHLYKILLKEQTRRPRSKTYCVKQRLLDQQFTRRAGYDCQDLESTQNSTVVRNRLI